VTGDAFIAFILLTALLTLSLLIVEPGLISGLQGAPRSRSSV
jgi:hypothetical protein